jgi:hypothetical protein
VQDWRVVRDVVNHEWRHPSLYNNTSSASAPGHKRYLAPRFIQGCSFNFMQPAGSESSEELSHIHLDSDAVLLAVEDPARPAAAAAAVGSTSGGDGGAAGVAVILAFRWGFGVRGGGLCVSYRTAERAPQPQQVSL